MRILPGIFLLLFVFTGSRKAVAMEADITPPVIREIFVTYDPADRSGVHLIADAYDDRPGTLSYSWHLLGTGEDFVTGKKEPLRLALTENDIVELTVTDSFGNIARLQKKLLLHSEDTGEETFPICNDPDDDTVYYTDTTPPVLLSYTLRTEGLVSGKRILYVYALDEGSGLALKPYTYGEGGENSDCSYYTLSEEELSRYLSGKEPFSLSLQDKAGNVATFSLDLSAYAKDAGILPDAAEESRGNTAFLSKLENAMEKEAGETAGVSEKAAMAERKRTEEIRLKKLIRKTALVTLAASATTASGGFLFFLFHFVFYANVYNRSKAGDYEECGTCRIRRKKGMLTIVLNRQILSEKETMEWKCTFSGIFLWLNSGKKLRVLSYDSKRGGGHDLKIAENAYFTL